MRSLRFHLAAVTVAATAVFTGCREQPVRSYQIPKEAPPRSAATPAAGQPSGMAAGMPGLSAAATHGITWTAPEAWVFKAPTSVRVGNYAVPGEGGATADFAVTVFPGDVGGDLANVNRWREQIGLGPIGAGDLAAVLLPVATPAGDFQMVNFANDASPRLRVSAALFKQPDKIWFFKLAGPDATVAAAEPAFRAFLQSVRFGAELVPPGGTATAAAAVPPAAAGLPAGHPPIGGADASGLPADHPPIGPMPGGDMPANSALPAGHPPIGAAAAADALPAAAPVANALQWAAPDHWVAKALGVMRRGSFTVKSEAGPDADLSIIVLGRAGNSLIDNVNRWRGQVGLAPVTAAQLPAESQTIEANGLSFTVVDFAGQQPGTSNTVHILGAITFVGDEAWFFKMTGPSPTVAGEKSAFLTFLRTVRPAH